MTNSFSGNTQKLMVFVMVIAFSLSSCSRTIYVQNTPPGHAKKAQGSKSAKPFAPGQVKKHRHK